MTALLLALAFLCPLVPDEVPVLRQAAAIWRETVRREGLPKDAIGWVNWRDGVIVVLLGHPEIEATIRHERAHIEHDRVLDVVDREEWAMAWQQWGPRLPWEPARRRAAEAYAYLAEWLSPESRYVGQVPVESVRLLLRLRSRER